MRVCGYHSCSAVDYRERLNFLRDCLNVVWFRERHKEYSEIREIERRAGVKPIESVREEDIALSFVCVMGFGFCIGMLDIYAPM